MSAHSHIRIWNYAKQKYACIPFTVIHFCFLFFWLWKFLSYIYIAVAYPAISTLAWLLSVTEFQKAILTTLNLKFVSLSPAYLQAYPFLPHPQ